mmetsp:Transcript_21457/g.59683  ORF Transcript_21457/g.59683 Transcript_21457/m.59683 type:complete len:240 (-) Transcript_21457:415-1134(-)
MAVVASPRSAGHAMCGMPVSCRGTRRLGRSTVPRGMAYVWMEKCQSQFRRDAVYVCDNEGNHAQPKNQQAAVIHGFTYHNITVKPFRIGKIVSFQCQGLEGIWSIFGNIHLKMDLRVVAVRDIVRLVSLPQQHDASSNLLSRGLVFQFVGRFGMRRHTGRANRVAAGTIQSAFQAFHRDDGLHRCVRIEHFAVLAREGDVNPSPQLVAGQDGRGIAAKVGGARHGIQEHCAWQNNGAER